MISLAAVRPGFMLRLDANGRGDPAGEEVTNPGRTAPSTGTVCTTEATPVVGTPARPVTWSALGAPGGNGPAPANRPSIVGWPERVSINLAGTWGCNSADDDGNQPTTSATSCVPRFV